MNQREELFEFETENTNEPCDKTNIWSQDQGNIVKPFWKVVVWITFCTWKLSKLSFFDDVQNPFFSYSEHFFVIPCREYFATRKVI